MIPDTFPAGPKFFPMRVVLRITSRTRLAHHHSAMICQLCKDAGERAGLIDRGRSFPARMLPDAVEVGRLLLEKDDRYASTPRT